MLNILEFNKDFKKMYKTNLIKLNKKFFEIGDINSTTGENSWSDTRIRLNDYITVKPKSKYLIKSNIGINIGIRFYGKDKKYKGSVFNKRKVIFNTPVDCYYIRFLVETTDLENIRVIIEPLLISQNLKISLKRLVKTLKKIYSVIVLKGQGKKSLVLVFITDVNGR